MKARHFLLFACLALASAPGPAVADDDAIVQAGQWSCNERRQCSEIMFSSEFGAAPNVFVSLSQLEVGLKRYISPGSSTQILVQAADITTKSFKVIVGGEQPGDRGLTGRAIAGSWVAVGPKLLHGSVTPSYIILTVLYAPPGTNGGNSKSNAEYASGSTIGTTTTASQSFKGSNTLAFEGEGGVLGNGAGTGISFGFSRSITDTQSFDIKKTINAKLAVSGPSHDGIDHDEDEIWLMLKPVVNLAVSSSTAQWMLSSDNSKSPVQWLQVGQLNGNPKYTISQGLADQLKSAGITAAEFQNILKHDPLACQEWSKCGSSPNVSPSIDRNRFDLINCQFPYQPPGSSTGSASPVVTWQQTNISNSTVSHAVVDEYTVGLSISQSDNYLNFAKAQLKNSAQWTWSNKSERSTSTGTTESATFSIGGPAPGYGGPTQLCVYYDTIYKTFAFDLVPPATLPLALEGTLVNAAGEPQSYKQVILVDSGVRQNTFTNAKGEFRFYGAINGPATVEAPGIETQAIAQPRQPAIVTPSDAVKMQA